MSKKNGFTLAEIMIVLVIIGVLTAILLPVAIHSAPDENIMKFKKGNNTLGAVIRELVNSDEYYLNGDLGKMSNGEWVTKKDYFLRTFSEIVTIKEAVYPDNEEGEYSGDYILVDEGLDFMYDTKCKEAQENLKSYIKTVDNIYYYQYKDAVVFGAKYIWIDETQRNPFYRKWDNEVTYSSCNNLATPTEQNACVLEHSKSGFYFVSNIFCMDVDNINQGEDPFGYGIFINGKIHYGARAKEWINKSIQKGE